VTFITKREKASGTLSLVLRPLPSTTGIQQKLSSNEHE
jgi:hypothetical protein